MRVRRHHRCRRAELLQLRFCSNDLLDTMFFKAPEDPEIILEPFGIILGSSRQHFGNPPTPSDPLLVGFAGPPLKGMGFTPQSFAYLCNGLSNIPWLSPRLPPRRQQQQQEQQKQLKDDDDKRTSMTRGMTWRPMVSMEMGNW